MSPSPLSGRYWTESLVIEEIHAEARAGHDLCYTDSERRYPGLVRAAERIFGTWATAITAAGFDYNSIRRYRRWTRERVIERIRALHEAGADLSWRNVATSLDPPLAAAALRAGRFTSWTEALETAGLDPELIAHYRRWTLQDVQEKLFTLESLGVPLDRQNLLQHNAALLAAVYRIGGGLVGERNRLQTLLTDGENPNNEQTEASEATWHSGDLFARFKVGD